MSGLGMAAKTTKTSYKYIYAEQFSSAEKDDTQQANQDMDEPQLGKEKNCNLNPTIKRASG